MLLLNRLWGVAKAVLSKTVGATAHFEFVRLISYADGEARFDSKEANFNHRIGRA